MKSYLKLGTIWSLILLPTIALSYKFWDLPSFQHQPLVVLIAIFLFLYSDTFAKPDKNLASQANIFDLFSTLTSLYLLLIAIKFKLVFLFWLLVPISFFTTFKLSTNAWPNWNQSTFILFIATIFPYPFPMSQFLPKILTTLSRSFATVELSLIDNTTQIAGNIIYFKSNQLSVADICGGINGFYATISLLFIYAFEKKLKLLSLVYLSLMSFFSIIFFNSLRISSMFLGSYFIEFEKAVKHFHTVGPFFFIPHFLLILFLANRLKNE